MFYHTPPQLEKTQPSIQRLGRAVFLERNDSSVSVKKQKRKRKLGFWWFFESKRGTIAT